jgi:DNA polymerase I-like protein with 3'-5' exonuclease and polymerase domains
MARIIQTTDLPELLKTAPALPPGVGGSGDEGLSKEGQLWVYCALDSMVTHEVDGEIHDKGDHYTEIIYNFERAQQAVAFSMMMRGLRVDLWERKKLLAALLKRRDRVLWVLNKLAFVVWEQGLNPNSPQQLQEFFYKRMNIEPITISEKGVRRVTTNEEALEKIKAHLYARPIANCILKIRELGGMIKVLSSGIDSDNRMRMSYNVSATVFGRWSSSKNVRGGGTNGQNITHEMREIFIADEEMKLAYLDLEQAESRAVAYISEDEAYIRACESGDLHTSVCAMVWPGLSIEEKDQKLVFSEQLLEKGTPLKSDKHLAETSRFDRLHDHRYMAKRSGHSSNYLISAYSLAKHLKIETKGALDFQYTYFRKYNGIKRWHGTVARRLALDGFIISALGRKCTFFGRSGDDAQLRAGVAFEPQSIVADLLNLGALRVWKSLDLPKEGVELLAQVHDAVLLQYREEEEELLIPYIIDLMTIPVPINNRVMTIPVEAKVGYDWKNLKPYGSPEAKSLERRRSYNENILHRPIQP